MRDRSNIPSLVGWDTVEIGFIENCPRTLPRYSGLLSSEDIAGINSIILRMYGGYNGKEINRTTSLVHFYPGDPSRFIKRAGSGLDTLLFARRSRRSLSLPSIKSSPRDNLLYWPVKVAQSNIVERGLKRGASRLSYNF